MGEADLAKTWLLVGSVRVCGEIVGMERVMLVGREKAEETETLLPSWWNVETILYSGTDRLRLSNPSELAHLGSISSPK